MGGGKGGFGKGGPKGGFGGPWKGWGKGADKGKGKGWTADATKGGGMGKGVGGKGYQGTCWTCGQVGHKAGEGKCGGKGGAERAVQEVGEWPREAADGLEVGGVWFVGQVAKAEDRVEAEARVAGQQPRKRRNWQRSETQLGAAPFTAGGGARRGEDTEVFVGAVEKKHMEMGFEVCDVQRALAAVSRITAKGNRVAFGPETEDNFIENVKTGQKIQMRKKGGAYVVDVALVGSGQKTEITIDSAAEESVCPEDWAKEFETTKLQVGEEMTLVSANGGTINHYGKRKVIFEASVF